MQCVIFFKCSSKKKRIEGKEYEPRVHAEKRRSVQALMYAVRKPSPSGREKMPERDLAVMLRAGIIVPGRVRTHRPNSGGNTEVYSALNP